MGRSSFRSSLILLLENVILQCIQSCFDFVLGSEDISAIQGASSCSRRDVCFAAFTAFSLPPQTSTGGNYLVKSSGVELSGAILRFK